MERQTAIKKLGKLLGKQFAYRVDSDAPSKEERDEAREKLKVTAELKRTVLAEKEARIRMVLEADPEYRRLRDTGKMLSDQCTALLSITGRHKFTVGRSGRIFFHVDAEGDSWEEVIEKVERTRTTRLPTL